MIHLFSLGHAAPVARVLLVEPGVEIVRTDGTAIPAEGKVELERDDKLITDPGGAVVLQLQSDHLVRIDSELTLRVADLAMLDAPPATASVAEQLNQILYPDERERFGGMVQETERIGGWHARQDARRGGGAGMPAKPPPPPGDTKTDDSGGFLDWLLGSGPEMESATVAEEVAVAPAAPPAARRPAGSKLGVSAKEADDFAESPLNGLIVDFQPGGSQFDSCVAPWAEDLPGGIASVELHARPADGAIRRVWTSGHIPVPLCLRDALLDKPLTEEASATLGLSAPTR